MCTKANKSNKKVRGEACRFAVHYIKEILNEPLGEPTHHTDYYGVKKKKKGWMTK